MRHHMLGKQVQRLQGFLMRKTAKVDLKDRIGQAIVSLGALEPLHALLRTAKDNTVPLIQILIGGSAEQLRQTALVLFVVRRLPGCFAVQVGEEAPILNEVLPSL